MNYPEIQTNRLLLRPLTLADAPELFKHFSDDEVTRFMDIDSLIVEQEAKNIINWHLRDPGCRWSITKDGAFIGTGGFHRWENNQAEIGYDLARAYWGQGLMKEALTAIIDFGFQKMKLGMIEAEVEPENGRSIGLLKNLGFVDDLSRAQEELNWYILFSPK
ncbi:MAG: GNAT family N-acetyltransferase [Chloroflexota bacterium]